MIRRTPLAAGLAVAVLVATVALATPAHANPDIAATSVGPSGNTASRTTDCSDSSLAVGMDATTVTTETGQVTGIDGLLGSFSQASSFSGFSGVFQNYGNAPDAPVPDGTVLASYVTIGATPPTSADTAEWLLVYRCAPDQADITILFECFGDYGSCPQDVVETAELLFNATIDDETPIPGQTITAMGSNCLYPVGGVALRDGGGPVDVDYPLTPDDGGGFTGEVTIPASAEPGTTFTVEIGCGTPEDEVLSVELQVTVEAGPATTTTTTAPTSSTTTATTSAPTTQAPTAVVAQPRFTG